MLLSSHGVSLMQSSAGINMWMYRLNGSIVPLYGLRCNWRIPSTVLEVSLSTYLVACACFLFGRRAHFRTIIPRTTSRQPILWISVRTFCSAITSLSPRTISSLFCGRALWTGKSEVELRCLGIDHHHSFWLIRAVGVELRCIWGASKETRPSSSPCKYYIEHRVQKQRSFIHDFEFAHNVKHTKRQHIVLSDH